ncbi:hypothetical protein Q4I30_005985 [Leishmania utingensis]|uniref:Uncharacterized protein n=1 Tax=Leishmania utingensis TaxID=653362 RepID=A0AAW3A8T7_9TRYP
MSTHVAQQLATALPDNGEISASASTPTHSEVGKERRTPLEATVEVESGAAAEKMPKRASISEGKATEVPTALQCTGTTSATPDAARLPYVSLSSAPGAAATENFFLPSTTEDPP